MSEAQEATDAIWNGVRRLCIAVDLERYSQRDDPGQIEAQHAMISLLRQAGERGALERAQWQVQPQGDGELALLPPGINEALVITSLIRQLLDGLHRYNRKANAATRLRMRVAVHEGVTYVTEAGFAGDAIVTVCRLRDAPQTKDALKATTNDLVLIVSSRIYNDVVCGHDAYDLPPSSFRETEIDMPDKGFHATAYLHSGAELPRPEPARPAPETSPRGPGDGGTSIRIGGNAQVDGGVAGRDINHYGSR